MAPLREAAGGARSVAPKRDRLYLEREDAFRTARQEAIMRIGLDASKTYPKTYGTWRVTG